MKFFSAILSFAVPVAAGLGIYSVVDASPSTRIALGFLFYVLVNDIFRRAERERERETELASLEERLSELEQMALDLADCRSRLEALESSPAVQIANQ